MTADGKRLLERAFEFDFASKEIVKASALLETNDAGMSQNNGGQGHSEEKLDDKTAALKKRIVQIVHDLPDLLDE